MQELQLQIRVGPYYIQKKMVEPQPVAQLLYTLPQKKSRLLVPKIISFILLGIIFYGGILINLSLLNIDPNAAKFTKLISLIILGALILLGLVINFLKVKHAYLFYPTHLQLNKKQIPYQQIQNLNPQQNFLDKLFKTYHLNLTKKFKIQNIDQNATIADYLRKMVNYSQH